MLDDPAIHAPNPPRRVILSLAAILIATLLATLAASSSTRAPPHDAAGCVLRWDDGVLRCEWADPGRVEPLPNPIALTLGMPIDINVATTAQLERLRGIGHKRAAAIVALRDARGGLCALRELAAVKGIGSKTVAKLRASLRVDADAARCQR